MNDFLKYCQKNDVIDEIFEKVFLEDKERRLHGVLWDMDNGIYEKQVALVKKLVEDIFECTKFSYDKFQSCFLDSPLFKPVLEIFGGYRNFLEQYFKKIYLMSPLTMENASGQSDIPMDKISKYYSISYIPSFEFPTLRSFLNKDFEEIKSILEKYESGQYEGGYDAVYNWMGLLSVCKFVLSDIGNAIEKYNFTPNELREMRLKAEELKNKIESLPIIQNFKTQREQQEQQEKENILQQKEQIRKFYSLLKQLPEFENATFNEAKRIFDYTPQEKSRLREDIQRALIQSGQEVSEGQMLDQANEALQFIQKLQNINLNEYGTEDINKLSNWYYFLKQANNNPPPDANAYIVNSLNGLLMEVKEKIKEILLEYQNDQKILDYLYNRVNPNVRNDFFQE